MDFKFNGITPENINFNGLEVDILQYNGEIVWQKTQPQPTENVYALFDGASYFNTTASIGPTNSQFKVVCGVYLNDKPNTTQCPFGMRYSTNYNFIAAHTNAASGWRINMGSDMVYTAMTTNSGTEYEIEMEASGSSTSKNCSYKITDLTHNVVSSNTKNSVTFNANLNALHMFVGAMNSSAPSYFKQYIKYVKIYKNNVLVNDFSFKEVEGVVKMYDSINNTYFDNLGSGTVRLVNIDNKDITFINTDGTTSGYIGSVDGADNKYVPQNAFLYNSNIQEIIFNENVAAIQSHSFGYCPNLIKVTFNGNTNMDAFAFEGCSQLSEIVYNGNTYYEGDKEALWQAFADNGLYVDDYSFNGTPFEKPQGMEENEVTELDYWNVQIMTTDGSWHYFNFDYGYIPDNRFYGRDDIQEVTIADGLSINYGAFNGCSNLNTIIITSDAIPSIDAEAFSNCYNLNYIQLLPGGSPYIDDYAFQHSGVGLIQYCESETDVWNTDWSKLIDNYGWNTENLC